MSGKITPEMNATLERQRAYFASDDHIRDRAAVWRDASPEECLEATREECESVLQLLAMKSPAEQQLALASEPIPADTLAILEQLQRVGQ